jgi:multiple sugar transport system permease protein
LKAHDRIENTLCIGFIRRSSSAGADHDDSAPFHAGHGPERRARDLHAIRLQPASTAWRFGNVVDAMLVGSWGLYFFNSIFVTAISVAGSLFFNSLAGFSFGVLNFRFKNTLFMILLVGIMIPFQVLIIPQYIMLRSVPLFGGNDLFGQGGRGWLDSYWALIIPQLSGSFGIFFARQYYLSTPYELFEAARIDGCTSFTTFIKVYLPLSAPLFASLGILKSVSVWNDFFYPLIMTSSDSMRTVQLGLQAFQSVALFRWELMMAATTLASIPLVVAFFLFQRNFVSTAASSGLKA